MKYVCNYKTVLITGVILLLITACGSGGGGVSSSSEDDIGDNIADNGRSSITGALTSLEINGQTIDHTHLTGRTTNIVINAYLPPKATGWNDTSVDIKATFSGDNTKDLTADISTTDVKLTNTDDATVYNIKFYRNGAKVKYGIYKKEDLTHGAAFAASGNYFVLANDITLTAKTAAVIPELDSTFDGNGKTINNLNITGTSTSAGDTSDNIGFIGEANGAASIKNLTINVAQITAGTNVGGMVGYWNTDATQNISDVTINLGGEIKGNAYVGGLVGRTKDNINNISVSDAQVKVSGKVRATGSATIIVAGSYAGGLIGFLRGDVASSSVEVDVTAGGRYAGGLTGWQQTGRILNSWASGTVTGSAVIGGLVASQNRGAISNSWASGTVSGSGSNLGGLTGSQDYSIISNSWASGTVSGSGSNVGGLTGSQDYSIISNSWASASVSGSSNVGGLTGWQEIDNSVNNAWTASDVTGETASTDLIIGGIEMFSSYTYGIGHMNAHLNSSLKGQYITTSGRTFTDFDPAAIPADLGAATNHFTTIRGWLVLRQAAAAKVANGKFHFNVPLLDVSSDWRQNPTETWFNPQIMAIKKYIP